MMGKRFLPALFVCLLTQSFSGDAHTQYSEYSIRLYGGMLMTPFSDWQDFYGQYGDTDTSIPEYTYGVSLVYTVLKEHSVIISMELSEMQSRVDFDPIDPGEGSGSENLWMDWDYSIMIVALDYQYTPPYSKWGIYPLIGLGASYTIVEAISDDYVFHPVFGQEIGQRWNENTGLIGGQAFAGLKYVVGDYLSLFSKLQYRHNMKADIFSENIMSPNSLLEYGDVPFSFSGFEFNLGVEVTF